MAEKAVVLFLAPLYLIQTKQIFVVMYNYAKIMMDINLIKLRKVVVIVVYIFLQ